MLTTLILAFLLVTIFGRFLGMALSASWGLTKLYFGFIFFPLVLIGLVLVGMIHLAIPMLLVVAIVGLIAGCLA